MQSMRRICYTLQRRSCAGHVSCAPSALAHKRIQEPRLPLCKAVPAVVRPPNRATWPAQTATSRFLLVSHQRRGCSHHQLWCLKPVPLALAAMERIPARRLLHPEPAKPATKTGGRASGDRNRNREACPRSLVLAAPQALRGHSPNQVFPPGRPRPALLPGSPNKTLAPGRLRRACRAMVLLLALPLCPCLLRVIIRQGGMPTSRRSHPARVIAKS